MPPAHLLLATDLSCRADRATERAYALARAWGAALTVVHVAPAASGRPALGPSWRRPPSPRERAERDLRRDLPAADGLRVQVEVEEGDPGTALLAARARHQCDFVVTGVSREDLVSQALLGSTNDRLARGAGVPVLVVKRRVHGPYRRPLVAVDFGAASRRALEVVLAAFPDAAPDVLHAYQVPLRSRAGAAILAQAAAAARDAAAAFVAGLPVAAPPSVVCEPGDLVPLIEAWLDDHDADLVAVGTQGRGPLASLFLGSVARQVVAAAPCDVLVVPAPP